MEELRTKLINWIYLAGPQDAREALYPTIGRGVDPRESSIVNLGNGYQFSELDNHYVARWWFQPHLKNISQLGSFPQVGVKIKNIF